MKAATKPKRSNKANHDRPAKWPTDGLATWTEAVAFLKTNRTTLWQLTSGGVIPTVPVGGRKRIAWSVLHAYANGTLAAAHPAAASS